MKNSMKILGVLLMLIACEQKTSLKLYEPIPGPYSTLVKAGKAYAGIVLPADPSYLEEYAASELQKYIEGMTSVKISVIKEGENGTYPYTFYIGRTNKAVGLNVSENADKMGRDGFEIKSVDKGLVILGRNDLGTLNGVYEILERYFDIRWFMPGEEYIPTTKKLELGQVNLVYKPSFDIRWVGQGDWALKQRMNAFVKAGDKNVGVNWKWNFHSFYSLMPPYKYYEKHPEYYAMVKGKRTVTDSKTHENQLCTANPQVIREVAKNLIDTLNSLHGIDIIALSPNDGGGFCECDKCRALDEENPDWFSRYSSRLAIFENEVAKLVKPVHPGVLIKVGAYAMYARPPRNPDYKPETNLFFQLCHLYFCHNHPLGSNMCKEGVTFKPSKEFLPNQEFEKILDQWLKLSPHLFIYEYYTVNGIARANLPWPLLHTIKNDIPYYYKKGVEGFYTQTSGDWQKLGLNFYLAAKLCWNANLNPDAILDDYFSKFYGPAAVPIKDYFMAMEKAMEDWNGCASYGLQGVSGIRKIAPEVFKPEVLERMEQDIIKAEKFSAKDTTSSKRVAMMRKVHEETKEALNNIK